MIVFKNLKKEKVEKFNNGNGFITRYMYADEKAKIMKITIKKGSSIGLHQHVTNLEVVYVLSGVATSIVDGVKEKVGKGDVIYCPNKACHTIENHEDKNLVLFCVIAETN
ncbi:MAG: cupin domain-containing protein [Acholeplasmatales bacterium]|nr:cupin domain-containing protein [Acholeplasmatales bacterium]